LLSCVEAQRRFHRPAIGVCRLPKADLQPHVPIV
jgi:hypothetical protein